jgi:type I restriction enzyme S subunit
MSQSSVVCSLPEICSLVTDGTHDSPKLQPYGIPFIKGKHISSGIIEFENCDYITEEDHLKCIQRVNPQMHDVLISNIGSVGDVARVTEEKEFSIKNVALLRPNPDEVDPLFFYYFTKSPNFRGRLLNLRLGAAQPYISLESLRSFHFEIIKSRKAQKRIGEILSRYDSLIENNRRRIQLLEQAARLLYKEWFVRLRFPGHEHVKIKDGVPEGWERKKLGDVAQLNYGKGLKEEERIPGPYPVYGSSGKVGTHEKPFVQGPGIIVGRKGNVGSVFWSEEDFHPIDTVYFIGRDKSSLYLYYSLLHTSFISTDVAVPGLNRDLAHSRELLIAEPKLKSFFEEIVVPIHKQIYNLQKYNASLAKARDQLLPRLMNGEITV